LEACEDGEIEMRSDPRFYILYVLLGVAIFMFVVALFGIANGASSACNPNVEGLAEALSQSGKLKEILDELWMDSMFGSDVDRIGLLNELWIVLEPFYCPPEMPMVASPGPLDRWFIGR